MNKNLAAGDAGAQRPALMPEQVLALRNELVAALRARRLSYEPRLTQHVLSQRLGYPYAVVTGWENGSRLFYKSNVIAWATALDYGPEELTLLLTAHGPAILPDERAGLSTGSRIELELNERIRTLRKERRLSIREMCEITGISTGHWQRIEIDQSNLSVAQVRQLANQLKVSYEWLIDGKGTPDQQTMQQTMQQEINWLTRENEVLESFRRLVEDQKQRNGR